jgi:hypothetical protein
MAIAGPSTGADGSRLEKTPLRIAAVRPFAPAFLAVCAVLCSTLVAGCTRSPASQSEFKSAQHEVKAAPVRATARARRYSEQSYGRPPMRRTDLALLAPQPAPDCEFNRSDVRTVDPNEWARLKIEYERQCYKDAEKATRDRLSALQASRTCEVEPVRQPRTVRQQSMQR